MLKSSEIKAKLRAVPLIHFGWGMVQYLIFCYKLRVAKIQHQYQLSIARPETLPLPGPMLRYSVHKSLDTRSFIDIGRRTSDDLAQILRTIGKNPQEFHNILDFACGCGRVLRHFHDHAPDASFHGSDINIDAIQWCQENMSHTAQFTCNETSTPTRFRDDQFDFIYVVSLFTHLSEQAQFDWLEELKRILKPGGTLLATVHGENCALWCRKSELACLRQSGFCFRQDHTGFLKLDGLPDSYQTTFHTRKYILDNWAAKFEIVKYIEGGINNHQDAILLTK